MERMINNRLIWFLEQYNILSVEQAGFRPGRSVMDSIVKLHEDILKAWIKDQMVATIFLDFEQAFDSVRYSILINRLRETGR